jgi:hypothetical protein
MENYSISPITKIATVCLAFILTVSAHINFMFHALCNNGTFNITPDPNIDSVIGFIALIGSYGLILLSNTIFVSNSLKLGGMIFGFTAIILGSVWVFSEMVTVVKVIHIICTVAMVAITITMLVKHFLNSRE